MIIQVEVPNGTNSVKIISCEKVLVGKQQMTIRNARTVMYEDSELEALIQHDDNEAKGEVK